MPKKKPLSEHVVYLRPVMRAEDKRLLDRMVSPSRMTQVDLLGYAVRRLVQPGETPTQAGERIAREQMKGEPS